MIISTKQGKTMKNKAQVAIIGGGLAGCEAALQLAQKGIQVRLYEMKPEKRSPAHHNNNLAEIVCSNSFGNLQISTATGLLKAEMAMLNCQLLQIAKNLAVPAGNALAVDRETFSQTVTERINAEPNIERINGDQTSIPTDVDYCIIATGPLTSPGLTQTLQGLLQQEQLYFFDAAAPIVVKDSIDFSKAFFQNRYDQSASETTEGTEGSYINCPLDKEQYQALIQHILQAEKSELKDFEKGSTHFFESCLPIEVLASRGEDTPRFGPMKPVGIVDPNTGKRPYAVIQLRQDNAEGSLYNIVGFQTNLKWGEQKTMLSLIPGLENAEVIRYGVMHRNTFINSPQVLLPTMQLKNHPQIFIAGQLSGVEGYTESIAAGLMASLNVSECIKGKQPLSLPLDTMMGALFGYITRPEAKNFQPINSNWGILPSIEPRIKDKAKRNQQLAERAQKSLTQFISSQNEAIAQPAYHVPNPIAVSPAG